MSDIKQNITLSAKETISKSLGPATRAVEKFKKSLADVKSATDKAKESTKVFQDTIGKIGKSMTGLGKKMTAGITVPVIAGMGLAVKSFADFEDGMLAVKNEMNDDAFGPGGFTDGFEGMKKSVLDFSKTTPVALKDLTGSLQEFISAGMPAAQAMDAMKAASKLAVVSGTDLKAVTVGLSTAMNSYNISGEHAAEVAGKFQIAAKDGAISVEDLSENMGRIGVTARSAGIGFEELLATVATASNAGIKGGEAFGALEQILKAVTKPTAEAQQGAKLLGMNFSKAELQSKGLTGFLGEMLQKIDKLGVKREDVFDTMLGAGKGKDAIAVISALTDKQKDYTNTLARLQDVQTNNNELNSAYETQAASLTNQLKIMKNELAAVGVEIGGNLAPYVTKAIGLFRGLMKWFGEHPKIASFAGTLVMVAAVVGPLLIGLGSLIAILGSVATAVTALATFFGTTAAVIAAFALGIPALIALLAGAAAAIIYNWESVKAWFAPFFSWMGDKIKWLAGAIADLMPEWLRNLAMKGGLGLPGLAIAASGSAAIAARDRQAPSFGDERKMSTSAVNPGAAGATQNNSTVTLDFKNPPPGMKAKVTSDKGGVVNLNSGVQGI